MKSSKMKNIVVKLSSDNIINVEVDAEIHFDDPLLEAATRAIEQCQKKKFGIIRPITECWEKKDARSPKKHALFNSYWLLVNAALYDKAELLRERFMQQNNVDLKHEPMKANGPTK